MNALRKAWLILLLFPALTGAQTYPGNFTSYSEHGRVTLVNAGSASLRFIFYRPDIVRVDLLTSPGTKFDSSIVVIQDTTEQVSLRRTETDSTLEIASSELKIICSKYPLRVSFYDLHGHLLLKEKNGGGFSYSGLNRKAVFDISQKEHFYGTGERGTAIDKRGQAFQSYNMQVGGYSYPASTMMINVPYVISSNGYSVYFENTYPGDWNFGKDYSGTFSYNASGGELSYYLISAESFSEHLDKYTWLTGRQPLPPRWAFGYIQSRYGYRNEDEARLLVETMRQKNIPLDAVILDLYWFKSMGDISWDLSMWKNPFKMMNDFLAMGIKTVVITEPYITEGSQNFSEAYSKGYLAKNSTGLPYIFSNWWSCGCNAGLLDLTNPEAQQWWWNMHPPFFGSQLAGIWTDLGEPERDNLQMQFYLGNTARVHNIYNLLWAKTIFNGFNSFRPNERLFNLTRSGYAGIQRYSVITWSGDVGRSFGGLAVQLPILLNMGLSGLAYHNSDIGGFTAGTTSPELYARWMQFGAFSPITRAHGTNQPTEPWAFGTEVENISRKFIQLRYQLLPYIYTMAYENYKTGMPLARPLFMDYPEDKILYNESSSYLWGSSILVSPVVEAAQTSKSVYLPEGTWIDFWEDKVYSGSQNVTVSTPIDKIPVFIKSGSIIPMQPVRRNTEEFFTDTLFLNVYPSGLKSGRFTLYEDDGKTLSYQSGQFSQTVFSQEMKGSDAGNDLILNIGKSTGSYSGKPVYRTYITDIHLVSVKPSGVVLNGNTLNLMSSLTELRMNKEGFFFDDARGRLYIQLKAFTDSSYIITAHNINILTNVGRSYNKFSFHLEQNFPNPFNPVTNIKFTIAERSNVKLTIYDILGRVISTLIDEEKTPGNFEVEFNAKDIPSGIYLYELRAGSYRQTRKMNLIK